MRFLLVYATYSGSTLTAAEVVQSQIIKTGHEVLLKNVQEISPSELPLFDVVILASPSWILDSVEGQPHLYMSEFLSKLNQEICSLIRFAIIGLGDSTYAHFCGAVDVIEEKIAQNNGKIVYDPLRIDNFYFAIEKNVTIINNWTQSLLIASLSQ